MQLKKPRIRGFFHGASRTVRIAFYDDARRWMQAMYATPSGGKPLRCEVQSISPRHSMI